MEDSDGGAIAVPLHWILGLEGSLPDVGTVCDQSTYVIVSVFCNIGPTQYYPMEHDLLTSGVPRSYDLGANRRCSDRVEGIETQ